MTASSLLGKIFADLAETPWSTPQAGYHRVLSGFSAEGKLTGEQLEGQHAEREDIAATIEGFAADLLGAHELRRAQNDSRLSELGELRTGPALLGETEIHDHRARIIGLARVGNEHDVLGLEIPMHDAEIVGVLESMTDLDEDRDPLRQGKGAMRPFSLAERFALEKRHHEIEHPVGRLSQPEDRANIGVIQPFGDGGFTTESLDG